MQLNALLLVLVIVLFVTVSGCGVFNTGKIVRTYVHNASDNVTVIIYKEPWQNLAVTYTDSSEIKVIESFNIKSINFNGSTIGGSNKVMFDYVNFMGNKTNLSLYINTKSTVDSFQTRDANAHIDIYLPKNTNYTIDYVDTYDNFPSYPGDDSKMSEYFSFI